MSLLLSLLLLIPSAAFEPSATSSSELQVAVTQFCELLKANNKAQALQLVHPDDINNFINRKEQPVVSWKILETDFTSDEHARVTVHFEQVVARSSIPVPSKQEWQKTDDGWKIRIPSPQEAYTKMREEFVKANQPLLPKVLDVYPQQLKIYEMANPKVGSFVVRNGLQSPAKILSFELDTSQFKILSIPDSVEPGNTERIRVAYLGEAQEENLKSEATLRIEQDGEVKVLQVPVIYNYADDVTRWLSQKAAKEMEHLGKQTGPGKPPTPPLPR